jgi:hypothetical protein
MVRVAKQEPAGSKNACVWHPCPHFQGKPLSADHRFGNSQPKQWLKAQRRGKLNADQTHRSERAHPLTTGCKASARRLQAFYGMMSSAFSSWGGDQYQRSPETPRRVGSRALASIKERLASLRGFRPRPALVSCLFRHQPSPRQIFMLCICMGLTELEIDLRD